MKKKEELITCPECHGQKYFMAGHNSGDCIACCTCSGEGEVTKKQAENYNNRHIIWKETARKAKYYLKHNKYPKEK